MLLNLQEKLQNKQSFFYMAYKVIKSKIFSSLLLFISMIIIVRHLPKEDFGLYALLVAYFAFFEVFLGGFDASLVRFINRAGKREQHHLFSTIIAIKTVILVIAMVIIIFLYNLSIGLLNIPQDKLLLYKSVYIVLSINFLLKFLITTFSNLFTSYMLYQLIFKIAVLNGLLVMFSALLVSYLNYGLYEYSLFLTLSNLILCIYYYFSFSKENKISKKYLFNSFKKEILLKTFENKILKYSTPLLGVSILSYFKNYLPTFLFGSMISLESLAVYTVFKKITDFIHKGYDGVLKTLYPILFKMVNDKSNKINLLFWAGLFLRLIIFVILWLSYDYILDLYKITESEYDNLIFIILISIFLIMYFATFSNMIILSGKNTNKIFLTAISRTIISIVIIYLLFNLFGKIGLIISMFITTIIGITIIVRFASQNYNDKYFIYLYYIVLLLLIFLIYGEMN